jgi:hypothetical protein
MRRKEKSCDDGDVGWNTKRRKACRGRPMQLLLVTRVRSG